MSGYPVLHREISPKQHAFDVVVSPTENITVSTFKDLVKVQVKGGSSFHFGNSIGIMGNFHGETVGRDGSVMSVGESAVNDFGQEWQVREDEPKLFRTDRFPQAPEQCILPKAGVVKIRRLGQASVSQEAAEAACAHLEGQERANCVLDVIAISDLEMASAV